MKIGITCYPTFGGSGVVASELAIALAELGSIAARRCGHGHDLGFTIVGVMAPTGTPNDRAAFVNLEEVQQLGAAGSF